MMRIIVPTMFYVPQPRFGPQYHDSVQKNGGIVKAPPSSDEIVMTKVKSLGI